jgi:hypothetical protein
MTASGPVIECGVCACAVSGDPPDAPAGSFASVGETSSVFNGSALGVKCISHPEVARCDQHVCQISRVLSSCFAKPVEST